MNVTRRATLAALVLAGLASPPAAAVPGSAEAFGQELGDRTLTVLEQPTEPAAKLVELKALLDEATDLELVSRLVLGRYWREASPAQQADYVALFKELVMQTMAERFSWYTGETFEILGEKPVDERDTMVSTRILRPAGKAPILVDWRGGEGGGGPRLRYILADGGRHAVPHRAKVAKVVNQRGIDGLLAEMRDRLAQRAQPS